jgi:hypothetical protein
MRRYAVRVLVAVLTFGLGVAFSLFLGLFKFQESKFVDGFTISSNCGRAKRVSRPAFLRVDSELSDPLKLSYLGPTSDSGMRLLVENRREQTISGFSLRGKRIWGNQGRENETSFTWNAGRMLHPGDTQLVELPPNTEGSSVLVDDVTFESGFTWINPRLK